MGNGSPACVAGFAESREKAIERFHSSQGSFNKRSVIIKSFLVFNARKVKEVTGIVFFNEVDSDQARWSGSKHGVWAESRHV